MAHPSYETLVFEVEHDWAQICLNRPDARNALSEELTRDFDAVLDYLAAADTIRGVTIRGAGDVFCAGGDLKGFKNSFQAAVSDGDVAASSEVMGNIFIKMRNLPQVIIMLVHGAAMAGGLGLVCAGDIVVAVADTKMGLTETSIGVVPAQIGRYIVERIGEINARQIMLTASRFTAREGVAMGLVNFVVADIAAAEAQEAVLRARVRHCAPGANAATKQLLEQNKNLTADEMVVYAGRVFAASVRSAEGKEGVASFIEKRKPKWSESS